MAAGDFRGEAHLGSRCGRVDSWAKVRAELPHARGDLVAEDHAGVTPCVFCPVTMRKSVPHRVVASTLRRTSRGPRIGSGRRTRAREPGEGSDAASMESMRPG